MIKGEWTLAGYKAFNDALARRLGGQMGKEKLETFVERGRRAQAAVDEHTKPRMLAHRQMQEFGPSDAQLAQLFTRRLHQVAAKVRVLPAAARETMVTTTAELVAELHLLSEEIEERLGR